MLFIICQVELKWFGAGAIKPVFRTFSEVKAIEMLNFRQRNEPDKSFSMQAIHNPTSKDVEEVLSEAA